MGIDLLFYARFIYISYGKGLLFWERKEYIPPMDTYKVIATVTWKFDSGLSEAECLEQAKLKLDEILECQPQGVEFDGFAVQVDIAKMKAKKRLLHIAEFSPDEVFPHIATGENGNKKTYVVDGVEYVVRMDSKRYHVFQDNPSCVCCGILGTKMILDINPGDHSPHFNLYAEENGRFVLMTKDHILPKSRGGKDLLENFQTMCCCCNNLKGAYDLEMDHIRELKRLWDNPDKLPRKELRDLINKRREELAAEFSGGKENDGSDDGGREASHPSDETGVNESAEGGTGEAT
jgi:hypothetical protein